jgi:hypothetical protein
MATEKYKDKKTLRTYRFSDITLAKLDKLSEESGLPRTGVLEQLIHLAEMDDDEQQGEGEEGGETVA